MRHVQENGVNENECICFLKSIESLQFHSLPESCSCHDFLSKLSRGCTDSGAAFRYDNKKTARFINANEADVVLLYVNRGFSVGDPNLWDYYCCLTTFFGSNTDLIKLSASLSCSGMTKIMKMMPMLRGDLRGKISLRLSLSLLMLWTGLISLLLHLSMSNLLQIDAICVISDRYRMRSLMDLMTHLLLICRVACNSAIFIDY